MAAAEQQTRERGRKLVILHSNVDGFPQGAVVHEGDFAEGTDHGRLRALGAVRDAEGDEHKFSEVVVAPNEAARSAEILRLTDESDRQRRQIDALQERLRGLGEAQVRQTPREPAPGAPGVPPGQPPEVTLMNLQAAHQYNRSVIGDLMDRVKAIEEAGRPGAPPPRRPAPAGDAEALRAELDRERKAREQAEAQAKEQAERLEALHKQQSQAEQQRGKGK
jgi:hypothetical protein